MEVKIGEINNEYTPKPENAAPIDNAPVIICSNNVLFAICSNLKFLFISALGTISIEEKKTAMHKYRQTAFKSGTSYILDIIPDDI